MLKRNQNIDSLIQGIRTITENRCSLLDEDVKLLNEVITQLEELKLSQRKNSFEDLLMIVKIVEMLTKVFFLTDSHS